MAFHLSFPCTIFRFAIFVSRHPFEARAHFVCLIVASDLGSARRVMLRACSLIFGIVERYARHAMFCVLLPSTLRRRRGINECNLINSIPTRGLPCFCHNFQTNLDPRSDSEANGSLIRCTFGNGSMFGSSFCQGLAMLTP